LYYIYKLTTLGRIINNDRSYLLIYIGFAPSYSESEKPDSRVWDKALGRTITWDYHKAVFPAVFGRDYAETLIRINLTGWNTYMHLIAHPATDEDWETMRGMVRGLQRTAGTLLSGDEEKSGEDSLESHSAKPTGWPWYGSLLAAGSTLLLIPVPMVMVLLRRKNR